MKTGFHVSISGGLSRAVDRAVERGCDTMQVFVSNPRGWKNSHILRPDIDTFRIRCEEEGIWPVFVHTIYLINLASPSIEVRERSVDAMVMNVHAAAALGSSAVVTHLGSHGGDGEGLGIERVIKALEAVFSRCEDPVPILLETTAGSGSSVGHRFPQLGMIAGAFPDDSRLGICLDTCHAFAAGYDLRTEKGLRETMEDLEREVGAGRLKLVHANDSKGELGSHLDRHEHIGEGKLGMDAFAHMACHPVLGDLPWILETPGKSLDGDLENIRRVRSLACWVRGSVVKRV